MAAPVRLGEPRDQLVSSCSDWYSWRIFSLRSNPPAESRTPRRARTVTGAPSRSTVTPRTAPSSTTSPVSGAFRHTGTPIVRRPA